MTQAKWTTLVADASIQRSSQTLSVIDKDVYIYGGELRPREPVDSTIYRLPINPNATSISPITQTTTPQPRVGAASTTLNGKIYIFSGRGGIAMAPIEESGAFWVYDPSTNTWSQVPPAESSAPYPAGRSYHALTTNGTDTIYLHAGCPEKGRLADLWAFNVNSRHWTELLGAPGPQRGGTSIAYAQGKVFRMNGFDGKTEQGGAVDVFDLEKNEWGTISYAPDGVQGPSARSVSCLLALEIAGRASLVTMFGERDPSALGHQGAGKMLSDVWAFDIEAQRWTEVVVGDEERPPARGWFAADVVSGSEKGSAIVVHGGLAESNERLGDVWLLEF
ncbi:kelch repeat protein [Aspergillus egyptiacus]|nr:kelch repeat protein [Aspergillus egyptiacus]